MNFEAVIFDMDGVLIDSEPIWHSVEKDIFLRENVVITEEMCVKAQGRKSEHVIDEWKEMFPTLKLSSKEYALEIENEVKKRISQSGEPIFGVLKALNFFKSKNLKMAVASSSKYHLIDTVVDKLNIRSFFDKIHSSEDEKFGKPQPDVFLGAAKKLGVEPQKCLVIEDSSNGVLAGKRAQMTVVAVLRGSNFENKEFDIANYKIRSLNEIDKIF